MFFSFLRPTFKYFTWYTCTLGLIGSMVMCFLISSLYSSAAIIVMLILAIVLHFRSLPTQWGSISQALIFHQVKSCSHCGGHKLCVCVLGFMVYFRCKY